MTQEHSTKPISTPPAKPYPEFPLFPHRSGQWAKKIRGRMLYFGKWADLQAALDRYMAQKDDLHAGRKPREQVDQGKTVRDLCNAFWNAKNALLKNGEISSRTMADAERISNLLDKQFGKRRLLEDLGQDDFAALREDLATRLKSPVTLRNEMQRVRGVFNFALKAEIISKAPSYGAAFDSPLQNTIRRYKAKKGEQLFEAEEIRRMLAVSQPLKAMILLGINCGFGPADCGTLSEDAVDLAKGWINYPRPKTGVQRRCPLWPETVEAIREAINARPAAKDQKDAGLVFITKYRGPWHKQTSDTPVSNETRKLLDKLGINGRGNFYCLRHTFQTIGDESRDFPAVRQIMGHADSDISANYRERISDGRLRAVAEHVRKWLFATELPGADDDNTAE